MVTLLSVLLSLLLATVVATILVLVLGGEPLARATFRGSLALLILGSWAGALWVRPGNEPPLTWQGLAAGAALLLLVARAAQPGWRRRHLRLLTSEADELPEMAAHVRPLREPAALREYYRGLAFWLVVVALVAIIAAGYLLRR